MKRQFLLTAGLVLIGKNYSFSQIMQPRDLNQIRAETKARLAKTGIWQEAKPQTPWEFREKLAKEKEKAAKN